ncbi:hypothetical protein AGMMS4952_13010 [Spirochaetia bacterium]|nr:hypothetical protein AGMMS4952_13010 [Spirochaetia bacterium]
MELTDALIDGAIDSITGYIVAKAAKRFNKPIATIMETFLLSNTYRLLSDKDSGLYWDSLPETYTLFIKEVGFV